MSSSLPAPADWTTTSTHKRAHLSTVIDGIYQARAVGGPCAQRGSPQEEEVDATQTTSFEPPLLSLHPPVFKRLSTNSIAMPQTQVPRETRQGVMKTGDILSDTTGCLLASVLAVPATRTRFPRAPRGVLFTSLESLPESSLLREAPPHFLNRTPSVLHPFPALSFSAVFALCVLCFLLIVCPPTPPSGVTRAEISLFCSPMYPQSIIYSLAHR